MQIKDTAPPRENRMRVSVRLDRFMGTRYRIQAQSHRE